MNLTELRATTVALAGPHAAACIAALNRRAADDLAAVIGLGSFYDSNSHDAHWYDALATVAARHGMTPGELNEACYG